jgi:hypothetical protein
MPVGDGETVRMALDALVQGLRVFASPTGARASILLMTGGIVVLGFLFLAFLFRSAIVGDIASAAHGRALHPRVMLPPESSAAGPPRAAPHDFAAGRAAGRASRPSLDGVFRLLADEGDPARLLRSDATRKVVRVYGASSSCERVRGVLAGGFESLTGKLAKVEETECRARGAPWCEFEVRHAVMLRVVR